MGDKTRGRFTTFPFDKGLTFYYVRILICKEQNEKKYQKPKGKKGR